MSILPNLVRSFFIANVILAMLTSAAAQEPAASFLPMNSELTARFPTKRINTLGWTMKVQVSNHRTADPMRIELEFAATGGVTTADQTITARLSPIESGQEPPQSPIAISIPFEIPQGTDRLRIARHAPKSSFGNYYQIQLYQDGRKIDDCQANVGAPIPYRDSALFINQSEQDRRSVLWVNHIADQSSRADSLRNWSLIQNDYPFRYATSPELWQVQLEQATTFNTYPTIRTIDSDKLTSDWIAYQPYDFVIVHRDEWRDWLNNPSDVGIAIQNWNRCGGIVVVRGGSVADPAKRIQVSQASEIGSTPSIEWVMNARGTFQQIITKYRRSQETSNSELQSEISQLDLTEDQVRSWKEWFPRAAEILSNSIDAFPVEKLLSPNGVRAESNLAGLVIHLGEQASDDPIEVLQWTAANQLMGWKRYRLLRSGVEPILGSSRFFQWVIPGVAEPPVYTFMGLLGVFVILVGPVAYRKSAKSGRSYLMFAIAPVLAIATTLSMLAYGVIADGFGTQTRIRQITWVDGDTADAVTRTRSTFFSGIRPSDGLTFPADADVTLYPDNQQRSWEDRIDDRFELRGTAIVTDSRLRLDQDFLPSRQQEQFVVHQPRRGIGRIRIVSDQNPNPAVAPEPIEIENQFKVTITDVLIADASGNYFFTEKILPGGTATGRPWTDKQASEQLGELYKRQWLISSIVDSRQNQSSAMRNYNGETFDLMNELLSGIDSVAKPTDGVFEFELQIRMQLGSKLPPSSFVCLMPITDDAIAVAGAVPTESIHFAMGSLP